MTTDWFENADKDRRWLVGVSGGADSVALLHLLVESGFRNLIVCHLDHRLRGRASSGDAKFVAALAEKLGLVGEVGRAEVAKLAKENGESMETAARRARQEFFRECAVTHRCQRVIVAHHADDQAETVLWNLLRGSHGLRGMNEVQVVNGLEFHRPLLKWRRTELRDWLVSRKLKWREDMTNAEPIAVRNRLRNEAIPLLAEISGRDPVAGLVAAAEASAEQRTITEWALKQANYFDPQGRIHLPALRLLPPELGRAAIVGYLTEQGISPLDRALVDRAMELLNVSKASVINLPGGEKRLRRREGRLWVDPG